MISGKKKHDCICLFCDSEQSTVYYPDKQSYLTKISRISVYEKCWKWKVYMYTLILFYSFYK